MKFVPLALLIVSSASFAQGSLDLKANEVADTYG